MVSVSTDFSSTRTVWRIIDSAEIGAPVLATMHPFICSHHRSAPIHLIKHGWLPTRMMMKKEQVQYLSRSRNNTDMLFHSCCGVSWGSPHAGFRFGGRRAPVGNANRRRRARIRATSAKNMVTVIGAFAVPILLVLVTVIVSMVVSEKLDREFEQEIARKRALMKRFGIQEENLDGVKEERESVLSRPRNRPKREE